MPGLGIALYQERILPQHRVLLVEGETKAIVMTQQGYPTVGIMGCKGFKPEWAEKFRGSEVTVALDPDATEEAYGIAEQLDNARVAELPHKPDDMIVKHGATRDDMEWFFQQARPA
jgi:DNA primase